MFPSQSLLMFHKWSTYYANAEDPEAFPYSERCAPSILITFINMVLFSTIQPEKGCETVYMYGGQYGIQCILVVISVCCIPVMLLAKPLVLRKQHNAVRLKTVSVRNFTIFFNRTRLFFPEVLATEGRRQRGQRGRPWRAAERAVRVRRGPHFAGATGDTSERNSALNPQYLTYN